MAWVFDGGSVTWPTSLKHSALSSVDKSNQCGDLVASLKAAERQSVKVATGLAQPKAKLSKEKAAEYFQKQRGFVGKDIKSSTVA